MCQKITYSQFFIYFFLQYRYEVVYIYIRSKLPDWARDRNPNGKVPILEHDGKILYESQVISEYLDAVFPGDKLTPADPYVRAKHAMLMAGFGKVLTRSIAM